MWTVFIFKKSKKILGNISCRSVVSASPLLIKRALLLSKMTRYDIERLCNPNLSPKELEKLIRNRGSNFESLMEHHIRHKKYENFVTETFKSQGIDTKVLTKSDYTNSWIEWCDVVIPVGGDGTFLLAASRIQQNTKPIIGFNSDPHHSEGFLCLPKKFSKNVKDVLDQLKEGSFKWLFRTRIRVTAKNKENEPITEDHIKREPGVYRTNQNGLAKCVSNSASTQSTDSHYLALNEVFLGEKNSAQVSYLEMQVLPGGSLTKVKSSGLCVSTGTGCTSWHLSMNRLTPECISQVLQCAGVKTVDPHAVAATYNNNLLFDPEAAKMCYTIRDLISAAVWPSPPGLAPRGFGESMWVRSHCRDAHLVIDGGASFRFNDGCQAVFQLHPDDSLRTVILE